MQSKFGTKNKTKKTTNHLRDVIVDFSRGNTLHKNLTISILTEIKYRSGATS